MAIAEPPILTAREQFLEERRKGIGGSDAHHLLNIEPYGCQRLLYYEKTGAEPDEEFNESGAIRRGNRLEEIAADYYAQATNRRVERLPHVQHPEYPWLVVHIDRAIFADDKPGPGVLECKCIGIGMLRKIKEVGIPLGYVAQTQWGMMATGYEWGSFAVYEPSDDLLISWDFEPNKKLQDALFAAGEKQWADIQAKRIPPRLEPSSEQCEHCRYRRSCQGKALENLPIKADAVLRNDKQLKLWLEAYGQFHAVEKLAKTEKDKIKREIAQLLGDCTKVRVPGSNTTIGASITYAPRRTWNKSKIAKERPDLLRKFATLDETKLSEAHPELMPAYKTCDGVRSMTIRLREED